MTVISENGSSGLPLDSMTLYSFLLIPNLIKSNCLLRHCSNFVNHPKTNTGAAGLPCEKRDSDVASARSLAGGHCPTVMNFLLNSAPGTFWAAGGRLDAAERVLQTQIQHGASLASEVQ